jgi:hypothetical protein
MKDREPLARVGRSLSIKHPSYKGVKPKRPSFPGDGLAQTPSRYLKVKDLSRFMRSDVGSPGTLATLHLLSRLRWQLGGFRGV